MTTATIRLRNKSSDHQQRVVRFGIPTVTLNALPIANGQAGITQDGWLWQKGSIYGDQTRMWIRAELGGNSTATTDLALAKTTSDLSWLLPPYRMDWLLDTPADAVLRLAVNDSEAMLNFLGIVETGPLVQVWKFGAHGGGLNVVVYVTLAAGQDVFDCEGYVVWNDGRTQSVMLQNARIEIRHGEQHAGIIVASLGQSQPIPQRAPHVLLDGTQANWLPDAMGLPFFFTLIAEPDSGVFKAKAVSAPAQIGVIRDAVSKTSAGPVLTASPTDMVDPLRLANAQAAHGGPIVAIAGRDCWSGLIGPHQAFLPKPGSYIKQQRSFADTARDPWAARPDANAKASGQTGNQGIWNRCPRIDLFDDADPDQLLELQYAATDYWVRSHHFLDATGLPRTFESGSSDPCTTYGTAPFWRLSGAAWGKNGGNNDPPFGWDHGERAYLDWQHRGNKNVALYLMLTGSYVVQDELDFLLASDRRDTRWRTNTIEAPRAVGRMLQEWAWIWSVGTMEQQKHCIELALAELAIVEALPTYHVAGPNKWLVVFSRNDDKNPLRNTTNPDKGYEAASPWEHSFVCDGATAWAAIFQRIGDTVNMNRMLSLAVTVANFVVDQSLIEHPQGVIIVVTYVKVLPNGEPNPPSYYDLPRVPVQQADGSWSGAKTDLTANCDMVYGGIDLTWWSGAVLTAAKAGNQKAQRIRSVLYQRTQQQDVEWLVGD